MVWVNNGIGRDYIDGEKRAAGAVAGYAHLQAGDVIDPGEGMLAFACRWLHIPSGKTGISRVACLDRADFTNYIAHWNAGQPGVWRYEPIEDET